MLLCSANGGLVQVQIKFPMLFNDMDKDKNTHTFLAINHACFSSYRDPNSHSEDCTVDEEFTFNNYKSSPDGDFEMTLLNDEQELDRSLIAKFKVQLSGSFVPIYQNLQ